MITDQQHAEILDNSTPNKFMRASISSFLQTIIFDESYIKLVKQYQDNERQYDFYNLLKVIRNGKKNHV